MEYTASLLWRLDNKDFVNSIFSGHGSARFPGRWNLHGMPVVYCSSTLSLTVLESLVHMSPSVLKKLEYVSVSAKVPVEVFEKREIVTIDDATKIDKKWREAPSPEKLRLYGAEWHNKKSSCILQVPSVVIPQENNYVLNPYHPDFKKIVTNTPQPFAFDPRTLK